MSDDQTLIDQAAAGDRFALARLMIDHYGILERHIARKLPQSIQSVVAVADVRQETLAKVFCAVERDQFEPRSPLEFAGWLKKIADNCLNDAIKHHTRQKRGGAFRKVTESPCGDMSKSIHLIEELSGGFSTPSSRGAKNEAIKALMVHLAGLPDEQREAIQLCVLDGHSLVEIARRMNRSVNAVRGLVYRAKSRLRDAMGNSSQWLSKK